MKYYFLFLSISLIIGAIVLLYYRLKFIASSLIVDGVVIGVKDLNLSSGGEGGRSKHIEIQYVGEGGESKTYVADNSLLVYSCKINQIIKLAIKDDKVMVKTNIGIYTAPLCLVLFGLASLYLFQS